MSVSVCMFVYITRTLLLGCMLIDHNTFRAVKMQILADVLCIWI